MSHFQWLIVCYTAPLYKARELKLRNHYEPKSAASSFIAISHAI